MQVGACEQLSRTIGLCARVSMGAAVDVKPRQDDYTSCAGLKFQPNGLSSASFNRQDELLSSVMGDEIPILVHGQRCRQLKHCSRIGMLRELEKQIGLSLRQRHRQLAFVIYSKCRNEGMGKTDTLE